jgi:hypothetical protein
VIGGTGLFTDGTAAAPSISFAADTDTGFYRDTSNLVGFTAGGASSLRFGSAGTIYGASNANYVRLNNSGGVELAAAGTNQNITLTPSGTGKTVIATGDFLIGSVSGLGFGGTTLAGSDFTLGYTGFGFTINTLAASRFISFSVNSVERARFAATTGNFLIGTTTDSGALLQVGTNTTTSAGGMVFGTDTTIFRSAAGAIRFGGTQTTLAFDMGAVGYCSIANASGGGCDIRLLSAGSAELRTNSTLALTLDSSQNAAFAQRVRTADGTLALPGHAFTNDNASGMYRPATNTLGFSSGGVLSLTLGGFGEVVCGPAGLGTTTTDGFFYLRAMAGVPTGVPTAYSGRVAATYDTTNNKLYIYNGAWKSVTLT